MKKQFKDADYPIYEIVCDDTERTGIRLLSIVDEPAIEMMGVAFSIDTSMKDYQFKAQEDKQMIIGPGMIPNKKILRKDDNGSFYYNVFKAETILKLVQKFNSQGTNRKINVDHSNKMVDAYIMENWIVEDTYYDKSRMYGFNVPVGTWMVSIKIEDKEFWNKEVKELGKFGFSIEGVMGEKPLEYSKVMTFEDHIDNLNDDEIEDILIEFKKWRSSPDSSNVSKIMYNDETFELVIQFEGGDKYTYFQVDFDLFRDIWEGNASCVTDDTSGEGRWWVGKTPSVGAAVYQKLIVAGIPYTKGGSLR
jgi:hypothetical protein